MKSFLNIKSFALCFLFSLLLASAKAQTCEWRLVQTAYNAGDPDGAGPAVGSASFSLQIRTISGSIPGVTLMTTGFSYQSENAMIPTTVTCFSNNLPGNITISSEFAAAGYTYSSVNQCNNFTQSAGGRTFDRTVAGTLETNGAGVTLNTTWKDAFTVTIWGLNNSGIPQAGYVMINSTAGGAPGALGSYIINNSIPEEFEANSQTFASPLPLGSAVPVTFASFNATCSPSGALVKWATAQESNSDYFEVERSTDGAAWKTIGRTPAAGFSASQRNYNQVDLEAGNALYRIKQVDKDGRTTYTDIFRANCEVKNVTTLLYPVPARDVLNVVIKSDKAARTQLLVFDITGKLVNRTDANVQSGTNNFRINLTGLSSGDYIIKSTDPSIQLNRKFTVVR